MYWTKGHFRHIVLVINAYIKQNFFISFRKGLKKFRNNSDRI